MNRFFRRLLRTLLVIAILWGLLTLFAEMKGKSYSSSFGMDAAEKTALIIYDPDPFYNLDQQVSEAVAIGLAEFGWMAKVYTVKAAEDLPTDQFDLFVFCANTYNWAPDWAVKGFIDRCPDIENSPVAAITLGSGSTGRSKRLLEEAIHENGGQLLNSETWWLMRPNDESRLEERNVNVATDLAEDLGAALARQLQ